MTTPTREELLKLANHEFNASKYMQVIRSEKSRQPFIDGFMIGAWSHGNEWHRLIISLGSMFGFDASGSVEEIGESAAALLSAHQAQGEQCPTCGEYEPRTGTCGTSDGDTKALCKRPPYAAQPSSAQTDQVWNEAVEAAWKICNHPNAGLFEPDGGSPTPSEMIENIAATIRSLKRPLQAQEPDKYEQMEREHLGDFDKRTGIYAEPASASGAVDEQTIIEHLNGLIKFAYANGFHELGYDPVAALSRAQATQPAQQAPAVSDADRYTVLGVIAWLKGAAQGDRPRKTRGEAADALQRLLSQPAAEPVSEQKTRLQGCQEAIEHMTRPDQSNGGDKP